jgi:hypothetical protein
MESGQMEPLEKLPPRESPEAGPADGTRNAVGPRKFGQPRKIGQEGRRYKLKSQEVECLTTVGSGGGAPSGETPPSSDAGTTGSIARQGAQGEQPVRIAESVICVAGSRPSARRGGVRVMAAALSP